MRSGGVGGAHCTNEKNRQNRNDCIPVRYILLRNLFLTNSSNCLPLVIQRLGWAHRVSHCLVLTELFVIIFEGLQFFSRREVLRE